MGAYLDNNGTTPLDPRVREAMLPWLGERHGNPASVHAWGRAAGEAVETAREQVAALLQVEASQVVFVASGSEANNAVLLALARASGFRGHLVVSALEHSSVRAMAEVLEEGGMEVSRVRAGGDGTVDPGAMLEALRPDTRLACLMLANNEVGTLQPVEEVAVGCRERGVPVLCDAVQAVGKVPVSVPELGVDYAVVAGHKFHGPLGGAALWIHPEAHFSPLLVGGSQERGRRASTVNVPAAVGLGTACELAHRELPERRRHLASLRDRYEELLEGVPDTAVHGADAPRLPNTSHVAFAGLEGEALLIRLDLRGFAVSTGSACSAGAVEPSATMRAMGVASDEALASLRVSFGMQNTTEEVEELGSALAEEVERLRRLAPA